MPTPFIHLHLHSEYSMVDGTVRIKPLVEKARALGMPAIAITDQHNLFALVKFYRAAEAAGIKPIVGADVLIRSPDEPESASRLVLLCQDREGYLNLCTLLSRAYLEGQHHGAPYVQHDWVTQHAAGLIALSAGRDGDIGQAILAGHPNRARKLAADWARVFPDRFYIELQRTGREQEQPYENTALSISASLNLPVLASNDVRFLDREDFQAHEARVCIHDGRLLSDKRRELRYSPEQYLKSNEEMQELFSDLPEALENTYHLAMRCNLEMEFDTYYLPNFPTPGGVSVADHLRRESEQGLQARFAVLPPSEKFPLDTYHQRLDHELDVINEMGFPGYFLIVADFIHWAKINDIPVGPGRGSGAGSLVAYALGITDLDPMVHELLFERFLNPERISMPDFDVDFCMEKRDLVIDYVARTYGRDQVAQIITYGSMAAKAVVRDCGRVLGHPYGFVDSIAKLVPLSLGITLSEALKEEPQLKQRYDEEEDTRALLDLAMSLEGVKRNAGKHAGGVVIAPSPLTDFTPLFCEAGGGSIVTQFDKDDVETIGLVKFDFLGLRTLTIIDWALKSINAQRAQAGQSPIELATLPMYDLATFNLLQACQTTAVFQLESRGMKDLIRKLVPDSFDEIVALVALYRPGPLDSGMVDTYVECKHGRTAVRYPHPALERILKPTYGVILYQEQVMQIAQELAGYTLGAADILRRAMGKKKLAEMAKQRIIFIEGAMIRTGTFLLLSCSILTALKGLDFFTIYLDQDPRVEAAKWAGENFPENSKVLSEVYDLGILPFNDELGYESIKLFNFYDLDEPSIDQRMRELGELLDSSDYIVVPSNRIYPTKLRLKDKYPLANKYYSDLFDGSLGFELVAEFSRQTFTEKIVEGITDQTLEEKVLPSYYDSDESYKVFDRPTVLIFKKVK